ncbi:MAG: chloride channel protein [Ahrensia sp.]|nr:chloride channel protein [Ahrensia sp.]
MREIIRQLPEVLTTWIRPNAAAFLQSREPLLWLLAMLTGIAVAIAAIIFREAILLTHFLWLGITTENVATAAANTHWLIVLLTPAIGGLVVGWLLTRFIASRRTGGVADVMEAKARGGRNIEMKEGLMSALISALSLGVGASAGREGPIVHLGATISTSIGEKLRLPAWGKKTLLGCGVAAAVSASFNAPIAGVLFAHEVILGHYSKRSFIPIVISSVIGTILSRMRFGDDAAFTIPDYQITSYLELPAFALLGLTCGAAAVLFQFALIGTDYVARYVTMPLWLRPAVGGLMIGAIGIVFPQVLGVGYEATDMALNSQYTLGLMLALIVFKTAATSITLASRFGGGVFSPSLYIGAMTGGAFGLIAAGLFPELASSGGLYAILGMGAVGAAVIGAPISTLVIVFELTGGYALSIALLLTVSIAVGINQAIHGRSYFQWQLETRGLRIRDGPHGFAARNTRVADIMVPLAEGEEPKRSTEDDSPVLAPDTTLEVALQIFDQGGHARLHVIDARDESVIIGQVSQVAALRVYNKALVDISVEEHR